MCIHTDFKSSLADKPVSYYKQPATEPKGPKANFKVGDRVEFTENRSPANKGDQGLITGTDDGLFNTMTIYYVDLDKGDSAHSYSRRFKLAEEKPKAPEAAFKVGDRVEYIGHLIPQLAGLKGTVVSLHGTMTVRTEFDGAGEWGTYPESLKLVEVSPEDAAKALLESAGYTITPPPEPEKTFTVELTQKEAETLRIILDRIAGHPKHTARGYADSVNKKLRDLGVQRGSYDDEPQKHGEIEFTS